MKNTALTILTGLALAATAQAGSSYYSSKGKEVIPPPPSPSLWSWFAGGSVGYITDDWDEEIYTLHFGAEYKNPNNGSSHAIFLEVGYTDGDDDFTISDGVVVDIDLTFDAEIVPITLNYKYERTLSGNLNWYVGAGAGLALYDLDARNNFGDSASENDTVFYAHVFTGLTYDFTESFELFGGIRYIFMDDPDFFSGAPSSLQNNLNPDGSFQIEIGARFNF